MDNDDLTYEEKQYPRYSYQKRKLAQKQEKKERISTGIAGAMIVVALAIDAFEGILNIFGAGEFVSWVISIAGTLGFSIWFWMNGVGFVGSPKKFAAWATQGIIGLVPVLNTLPELTLAVIAIIVITRAEDGGGIIGDAVKNIPGKK